MPNTELLRGIEGLLDREGLEPEARVLIELAIAAHRLGGMPSLVDLRVLASVGGEGGDGRGA
jgi:hypothetical protein